MANAEHFAFLYRHRLLSPSLEEFNSAALDLLSTFRGQKCDGEAVSRDFRFLEAQYSAVAYVLIRAADDSAIRKEVGLRHAVPLVTYLTASHSMLAVPSMRCLQVLQYYYPSACGNVSQRIESYAVSNFSSHNADVRRQAACLYALTTSMSNKKDLSWGDRFRTLLRTSHEAVCSINGFRHVDKNCTLKSSFLSLNSIVDIPSLEPSKMLNVCRSVLYCLVEMVKIGADQTVELPVLELIACFECLSLVIAAKLKPDDGFRLELQEVLTLLFDILTSIIAAAKLLFAPFCSRICHAFFKLLKSVPKGHSSNAAAVRALVYDGLTSLFTYLGAASKLHLKFQDILQILQEEMSICALWLQRESDTQHKLHGQRQHIYLSLHANVEQHISVQKFLRTLEAIVSNVGSLLPPESYQMLQLFVLRMLPRCETITEDSDFVVRSIARKLRTSLCRVLNAFLLNPHPKSPYYLNVGIDLLRRGAADKGDILTALSKHGLSICDRIAKPVMPISQSITCIEAERNTDGTAADVEILSGHLQDSFSIGKTASVAQKNEGRRRSPSNDVVVAKRQRTKSTESQRTSDSSEHVSQTKLVENDNAFQSTSALQVDSVEPFGSIEENYPNYACNDESGSDIGSDSGSSLGFEINLVPRNDR
ncbi:hypothetical protein TTRE_0000678201 [Trichuris trichiura]|uniref:Pre-rRNA-processing protein RIX1 N-terminal domain-containing protein n=1 Tax=Trichuris trichiura TaxID=36087 RepID=A0A077ZIM9_TRITR|nr:hypothetical protein TTRE_0000678201 [Trichuris trichiura]